MTDYSSDYAGGAPQQNDQQRNAIAMALMGIANPGPQNPLLQRPRGLPTNVRGGLTSIGDALGGMRQPAPQAPGAPMSLAPPPPTGAQPAPVAPPTAVPLPQGRPVGADPMPQPALPPQQQGPQGLY